MHSAMSHASLVTVAADHPALVASRHLQRLLAARPAPDTVVVANPADCNRELNPMSVLAPLLAIKHQAALLLTNDQGDNTAAVVGMGGTVLQSEVVGRTIEGTLQRASTQAPEGARLRLGSANDLALVEHVLQPFTLQHHEPATGVHGVHQHAGGALGHGVHQDRRGRGGVGAAVERHLALESQ